MPHKCSMVGGYFNPKRIMRGPHGPRNTSMDDPAAIIGTQEPIFYEATMTCHQLCLSFIPDENNFGVRADPTYPLV